MADELDDADEAAQHHRTALSAAATHKPALDRVPPLIAELYGNATQPLRATGMSFTETAHPAPSTAEPAPAANPARATDAKASPPAPPRN